MTTENSPVRSRTATWDDPMRSAGAARTLPGREFLEAIARGELPVPPVMRLLNVGFGELDEGRIVFTLEPAEYHYNPIGSVHGGVITTLCDSAMGCAIQSTLPAGAGYTTLEVKVNFVRPVTVATGSVRCEGRVIHVGGRVATAESTLTDAQGKLYAHATTTCMIFRPEAGGRS
jgi:uncharacterized protein (TIGR00369 family)